MTLKNPKNNFDWVILAGWLEKNYQTIEEITTLSPAFRFTTDKTLCQLELLVPDDALESIVFVSVDGNKLFSTRCKIFDDNFLSFCFDVDAGKHEIVLELRDYISSDSLIYLRGNFDADVEISGEKILLGSGFISEFAKFTLSERRSKMKTGISWTEQGQPLYSGAVDYEFNVDFDNADKNAVLVIGNMHDSVKVYLDENLLETVPCSPCRVKLGQLKDKHKITLSVSNTLGGMMEYFKIPSGLLTKPYITFE